MATKSEADTFLCHILRGESPSWPADREAGFEHAVFERSGHHGVRSLICSRASSSVLWDSWPESLRESLQSETRADAARDLLRGHALKELLAALAERDIQVLVVKGAALAGSHYAHSSLRTRCDTDLFIDLEDIERVREALAASGFVIVPPVYKSHQFVCVRSGRDIAVEFDIHWRILNSSQFARAITFEEAWKRSVPLAGSNGARTLCNVDALMLACMHRRGSSLHDPDRLIWLYDIHLLGSSMSLNDWLAFAERAAGKGIAAVCLDGLLAARASLATVIPDGAIRILGAAELNPQTVGRYATSHLALLVDDLRQLPGMRPKSRLVAELLFPSGDALLDRYQKQHRAWLPLLYCRQVIGGMFRRLSLQ